MNYQISKGQILSISSNEDSYRRGEQYYKSGKVLDIEQRQSENGFEICGLVQGNYKQYEVSIGFNQAGSLTRFHCTCQAHGIWRGACKHVAAVLFGAMDMDNSQFILSSSNAASKKLAEAFESRVNSEISGLFSREPLMEQKVHVIPTISIKENEQVYLSFTLGTKKQYVVKSANSFLEAVKNEASVSYGKSLEFVHRLSAFDEESVKLIQFALKEYNAYRELYDTVAQNLYRSFYSNRYYSGSGINSGRNIFLGKRSLDDFFELYKGAEVSASVHNFDVTSLFFQSGLPPIKLKTSVENDILRIEGFHCKFLTLKGQSHEYLLFKNSLYKLDKDSAYVITTLLETFQSLKNPFLSFQNSDLNKFIMYMLPKLTKLRLIDEISLPDKLQFFTPAARYYFDAQEDYMTCKLIFKYGEYELNPLLPQSGNEPLRDLQGEYKALQKLTQRGFLPDSAKGLYLLADEDGMYDFYYQGLNELNEEIESEDEIYVSNAFENKSVRQTKTSFGVRISGNLLEMNIHTANYDLSELLEAVSSYARKKKYHRFKDGRFLSLETDDMKSAAEIISSLDLTKKELQQDHIVLPKYRAMYLENLMGQNREVEFERDKAFKKLTRDFRHFNDLEFPIPEKLEPVLRGYQKTGFNWLKMLSHYGFGGILADDMGLGKTIQIIALLLSERGGKPSLVVTPTSVLYNWQREIEKFAPELQAVVVAGLPAKRGELLESSDTADVFITTYDMLKRDTELYEDKEFRYVIADEAQNIKNPGTQNAQAIKMLKSESNLALTGTPIENSLMELWSIFDFIMPGYLFNQHKFSKLYETPIVKSNDSDKALRLQRQIAPFILRRIKNDVLKELPDKLETILYAEMEPEQKKIYTAFLLRARGELDEVIHQGQFAKNQIKILAELTRLRQICCHPSLFMENYTGGSGKLELAIETIVSTIESGHRILLFSGFTSMLAIILRALDEQGINYFYLDGSTDARTRSQMSERFNLGEKDIFLISLKAGGTGLNLTGADVVIHFDPWWNPAVMDQASDRAHRYGQKKVVQVLNIVAKDSIEEKILALQERKKNLVDSVIKEGASFLNKMSEEEVRELFL